MRITKTERISELKYLTRDQIDDVLIKIGKDARMRIEKGVEAFLCGNLVLAEPRAIWREENGIAYLPVITTDGTSGETWIKRLEDGGFNVDDEVKTILMSPNFKATSGVTIQVAILLREKLFRNKSIDFNDVKTKAFEYNLSEPNAEVACILLEQLSKKRLIKKMGLNSIDVMHGLIKIADEEKYFMRSIDTTMKRLVISDNYLRTGTDGPWLFYNIGFAYVAQTNTKS